MTSLPDEIQHCITLQELRVDGNRLRAIPDVSRTAFDLRVLTAAECELSTVPEWLGACRKLHTLELGRNKITSPIVSLRECVSLRVLDISSNDVRALPELPRGLTRLLASENKIDDISAATSCADIHTLDAERNKITSLPDDIAELHKLVVLKVAKNLLRSVDAPNMSRRASRLETFTFSQNPLGAIPWWLADVPLSALEPRFINETAAVRELRHTPNYAVTLDLGNRGLLHAPTIHPHFPSLTTLDLSHNSIGFLPSHVSELTALEVLRLNDNFITFLPDCSKMKNLRDLRAHSNRLMSVHASVCTLRQLETLYIGKNPLSALPDLTPCLKLKTLWMAECRFESLPLHIADCPSLTNFYAEGNPLKFPEPSVYEKEGNLGLLAHLKNINENKREQEEMSRIREAEKARKIKAKEEKAAARLRAILRFGKSHLAREEESEEEEEEEEEEEDDDADTVRSGATAATARSAKTATSSSGRSTKRRGAKAPSMGKVLWRRLRQVVVDDSSNKREAVVQARMDYDTLLRVRDLKFAVKLADANAALAATNAELRDAELERADADEGLARAVAEVRAIRRKMADQRALMEKFKSISSDTLQELQEKLRDAKVALAEAVGRKEAADAIVATKERRATELSIEIFNLEERAVAVKDELETRSRERLLAKMTKRRSDLEALRETARKGEATMAAVERANESSLLTRMQTRKKDLASRDEKEAAAVREAAAEAKGTGLGYLLAVGMDKTTDETTRAKASKAWGKLQLMNGLGLLRGRASGKMGLEEVKEKDPADA